MKDIEDKRWRQAAVALGLDLFDLNGAKVSPKRATRSHSMRGVLEERNVVVRYGQRRIEDGITVIEIHAARPMHLGLKVQVSAPPKAPNGRFAGPGHTVISGIEPDRIADMLSGTESGRACMTAIRRLGSFGWAQLTDTKLRSQSEIYVEAAEGYVQFILSVLHALRLAEAARAELRPAAWEIRLAERFHAAAGELQLDHDRTEFDLHGLLRRVPVRLQLKATDKYSIQCAAEFPKPLPDGSRMEPRVGWWSRVVGRLPIGGTAQERALSRSFKVSPKLRERLTDEALLDLNELSHQGDVRISETTAVFESLALDFDVGSVALRLVRLVEHLSQSSDGAPYR